MHLVEIFIPTTYPNRSLVTGAAFERLKDELTQKFGGVTAFTRAPADGRWRDDGGAVIADTVVIFEVMVETLDIGWWQRFKHELMEVFKQEDLMLRATHVTRI